ncbi:MAG: choice-of-anchor D domain-containing protein [Labilithrix sp.]|nr:choice-of-anchor D domain-containing protein [Labilithrix sp.]MCW5809424.1 choice-of-anchor D domain-containing protein [Labilithrix sp.]
MSRRVAFLFAFVLMLVHGCASDDDPGGGPAGDAGVTDTGPAPLPDGGPTPERDSGADADAEEEGGVTGAASFDVTFTTSPEGYMEFGTWSCGAARPPAQTVTVTNSGPVAGAFDVTKGPFYGDWFELGGSAGGTLAPGASTTFTVRPIDPGIPTNANPISERIDVVPLGTATGGVTISARFARSGPAVIVQGAIDFGDRPIGSTAGFPFGVSNVGNEPVTLAIHTVAHGPFDVSIPGASGGTLTLAAGASITGTVTFAPVVNASGDFSGSTTFAPTGTCSAAGGVVTYSGSTRTGSLQVSGDLDFGETRCHDTAVAKTVTLSNSGGSSLSWTAALGRGATSSFSITPASGTLAAGGTASITVTPKAIPSNLTTLPADYGDLLTITSTVPGDADRTIALRQRAGGAVLRWVDSRHAELTAVAGVTTASETFTLENRGNAAIPITFATSSSTAVTIDGNPSGTLAPGGRATVRVKYAPAAGATPERVDVRVQAAGACSMPDIATDPAVLARSVSDADLIVSTDRIVMETGCGTDPVPQYLSLTNTSGTPMTMDYTRAGPFSFGLTLDDVPLTIDPTTLRGTLTIPPATTKLVRVAAPPRAGSGYEYQHENLFLMRPGATEWSRIFLFSYRGGGILSATGGSVGDRTAGARVQEVVYLTNGGNQAVEVFAEHLQTGEFVSVTVPRGTSVPVRFWRTVPSGAFTDTIRFHSGATGTLCGGVPADVTVTGEGKVLPLSVDVASVELDDATCGSALPQGRTFQLTNHSAVAVPFSVSVEATTPLFDVNPPSGTLAPGESVTVRVLPKLSFDSTIGYFAAPGEHRQLIAITAASANTFLAIPAQINVRGMVVTGNAGTYDLGAIPVGETRDFWLVSTVVQGNDIHPLSLTRVQDPSNEVRVEQFPNGFGNDIWQHAAWFTPALAGPRSAQVKLSAPPGTPLCAPLASGNLTFLAQGTGALSMDVYPREIDFGEVDCGTTPSPRGFVIKNTGTAPLPFTVEAAESGSWLTPSPASGTIAVGASQTITLSSAPVPRAYFGEARVDFRRTHAELLYVHSGNMTHSVATRTTATGVVYGGIATLAPRTQAGTVDLRYWSALAPNGGFTFPATIDPSCTRLEDHPVPDASFPSDRARHHVVCPSGTASMLSVSAQVVPGRAACSPTGVVFTYP